MALSIIEARLAAEVFVNHKMKEAGNEDLEEIFEDICYNYIGPVLCVFGILGNIIGVAV